MSVVYSPFCGSRLLAAQPTALLLHYFFTTHYCLIDTFSYICASTQEMIVTTRVYLTPPIMVAQPQFKIVTTLRSPSMTSHSNKHLSTFPRIVLPSGRVTLSLAIITYVPLKTLPFPGHRLHTSHTIQTPFD